MRPYDAVIIGARCAGAATGIFLAQRGRRVLLIDRALFPSGTLSTHVFGDWEIIQRLGVMEPILSAGAPRITRFRTDVEGCVLEADLIVTPFVLGLRRERLDAILLERAASFPEVTVAAGTTVDGLLWDHGQVIGATIRSGTQPPANVYADIVIGADGASSLVARAVGATAYLSGPEHRCAYYAYYSGVDPAPIPAFEFYWSGTDIILVNPCDEGLHCCVVMPPQADFRTWKQRPALRFETHLRRVRMLAPRLLPAERRGPVRGSGTLRSFLRESMGPGWALVGDAGACIHPCIGAGIDNAFACAEMLAETLHQWWAGRLSWSQANAEYQRQRDQRVRPVLEAALRLAERPAVPPDELGWLRLLCTMPGVAYAAAERAEAVVSTAVGDTIRGRLRALLPQEAPQNTETDFVHAALMGSRA